MMHWKPIDTAPLDTPVLIWDGAKMVVAENQTLWPGHKGEWSVVGAIGYDVENDFYLPTHWAELPSPPKGA